MTGEFKARRLTPAGPSVIGQPSAASRVAATRAHLFGRFEKARAARRAARMAARDLEPPPAPPPAPPAPPPAPPAPPVLTLVKNSWPNPLPPIPNGGPFVMYPYFLGETIFVVASGPSLKNVNFKLIEGRKIICVNSSYEMTPYPTFVYFGDGRWWRNHGPDLCLKKQLDGSHTHLVTCSGIVKHKRLLKVTRFKPSAGIGFSADRNTLASQRTSLQGAMNLAAHLNSDENTKGKIVLIAADMGRDPKTGVSHGHKPHPWVNRPGNVTWDEQMRHLKWIVKPLQERGIEVVNTSMVSRIPWFKKMTLEDFLAQEKLK